MSSVGHKVKGAIQVVHGMGDNIRGTTLGAVDTLTSSQSGETKNDVLAQKGRQEMQEGLTNIKGVGYDEKQFPSSQTEPQRYGPVPVTQNPQPGVQDSVAMTNPNATSNQTREAATGEFPQHHRDDAISNDPKAIAVGQEFANSDVYNGAGAGGLPASDLPRGQGKFINNPAGQRSLASEPHSTINDQRFQNTADATGNGFYHEKPGFPIGPDVPQRGTERQSDFAP